MNGSCAREMLNLMPAGKARRGDDGATRRGSHGWQELSLAHGSRQLVVLALVSKRACHAAAAGIKVHDFAIRNPADQAEHGSGSYERLLVAVSVDEHLLQAWSQQELRPLGPL